MPPTTPFPLANLPADLFTAPIPDPVDHAQIAKNSLTRLLENDLSVVATAHAHWRDMLALSSTLRTFNSSAAFKTAWKDLTSLHKPGNFDFKERSSSVVRIGPIAMITAEFYFVNGLEPSGVTAQPSQGINGQINQIKDTIDLSVFSLFGVWILRGRGPLVTSGRCHGYLKIAPEIPEGAQENGARAFEYKIFSLSTILESVDGYGDPDVFPSHISTGPTPRVNGTSNGTLRGLSQSQHSSTNTNDAPNGGSFDALVVGLGPSGLSTIARLTALGLNAIACDKIPELGLNWTERYNSLKLHTPKMQNSLPFNFKPPKDAPYYLTANDLRRYYQSFVEEYKLNDRLWLLTSVKHASYDKSTSSWTVILTQSGQERVVSTRHLVFCLGMTGRTPKQPSLPGRDKYPGTVIHAVDYVNSHNWAGKRGIVIGTANTGHDIAEDMVNAGMHVTMYTTNTSM
ncbi:hypothetical protein B0J12DRAFT_787274 [Macrophomina phaseolina]|uniref:Flavin-containing monooxygenase-like protein n=1 Tax=Macrophomina phaseolina TaxID=35725 RepID=A0ABQ8G8C5_9PEZI|nr:hypothetical protein B0J12DRAFT_787274 [Macrophomina phaseolina]